MNASVRDSLWNETVDCSISMGKIKSSTYFQNKQRFGDLIFVQLPWQIFRQV